MTKKLNSHQIRKSNEKEAIRLRNDIVRNPVVLVLDNVLDTYNIGSFFRLADAIAAQKIYLCGQVVTPPNIKIHRASIGTWKWVPWQHCPSTKDCITNLKKEDYQIIAVEQTPKSISYNKTKYGSKIALVVGSESNGVSEDVIREIDKAVEIPMFGINKSLNVLVAASVISYHIVSNL